MVDASTYRSVREAHHEGQCDIEAADVCYVEMPDRLSDPCASNRDGLVGLVWKRARKPFPSSSIVPLTM
jgi:hypothetical protein